MKDPIEEFITISYSIIISYVAYLNFIDRKTSM